MIGMSTPSDAVSTYILAKDGNRPFLMRPVFAEDAELEMVVKTDAISFPSSAKGVSAIEDILDAMSGRPFIFNLGHGVLQIGRASCRERVSDTV